MYVDDAVFFDRVNLLLDHVTDGDAVLMDALVVDVEVLSDSETLLLRGVRDRVSDPLRDMVVVLDLVAVALSDGDREPKVLAEDVTDAKLSVWLVVIDLVFD